MHTETISTKIKAASGVIGKTFPLYSFVTSNPLSGYEHLPFQQAIQHAQTLLGGDFLPSAAVFRSAWERGEIHRSELTNRLTSAGFTNSPEHYLETMDALPVSSSTSNQAELNRLLVKWLSAFLDEGIAEWTMPYKEDGFYSAWRLLAIYDSQISSPSLSDIPKTKEAALQHILQGFTEQEQMDILEYHLAALPGWTGYIKYREENQTAWQQEYTITLADYLAVRLWLANHLTMEVLPTKKAKEGISEEIKLKTIWLEAWEKNWQENLVKNLETKDKVVSSSNETPDAQLVFCIDTRSELIRRNIESKGKYETFGYAGFFGIAMDYQNLSDGIARKSCPPIVPSAYLVTEKAQESKTEELKQYQKKIERKTYTDYFLKRLKSMLPSAFGYVEGSGFFYGLSLVARTWMPGILYNPKRKQAQSFEHACEPAMHLATKEEIGELNISVEEKTAIVLSAFRVMGWNTFAPIVVFAGHGSHTVNNPFGSSLDCGACAASPGRHNARMLAKLANIPEVRASLKQNHQINIPDTTIFIGAEHNTTTDEMVLFDSAFTDTHKEQLTKLKQDLHLAQETATQERLGLANSGISLAQVKANNWSETRPEWGLAKNAGFIIGPRSLTKHTNLQGNCFMNSYQWDKDTDGTYLEAIMQGPMVVTQWINNHYYFATVDNETFGGGSKITHNITGTFGVVQGNGGDLKFGLPLQSVNETDENIYHKPLRLSVMIQAPKERVATILQKNKNLQALVNNQWIHILVMDPTENNSLSRYHKEANWIPNKEFTSIAS